VRDAVTVTETVAAADNAAAVTGIIVGNGTGGRDPGLTRDQLIKGACLGGALFRGDLRGTERLTANYKKRRPREGNPAGPPAGPPRFISARSSATITA